jgi:hypothetical protein
MSADKPWIGDPSADGTECAGGTGSGGKTSIGTGLARTSLIFGGLSTLTKSHLVNEPVQEP